MQGQLIQIPILVDKYPPGDPRGGSGGGSAPKGNQPWFTPDTEDGLHGPLLSVINSDLSVSIFNSKNASRLYTARLPNTPSEYDLNVGSLVDTLQQAYPMILEVEPDLSLFKEDMVFCGGPPT